MEISRPHMKGFSKAAEELKSVQDSAPELVKQPFPIKQFLLACLCILIGSGFFLLLSNIASLNPDPLKQSDPGFSIQSLNYMLERNAPSRIPVIKNKVKIEAVAVSSQNLGIRFEDKTEILLVKNLSEAGKKNEYNIQTSTTSKNATIKLAFVDGTNELTNDQRSQLDDVIQNIDVLNAALKLTITVYAYNSAEAFQNPSQQSLPKEVESTAIFSHQNPMRFITSIPADLSALRVLLQWSPLSQQSAFKQETEKKETIQTSKNQYAPLKILEQQTKESNSSQLDQVDWVSAYLKSNLPDNFVNNEILTRTSVEQVVADSAGKGVMIEISQSIPELQWQEVPINQQAFETGSATQTNARFQILNHDIINLIPPGLPTITIAVLPSALQRFYGPNINYENLRPQSYPSILSLLPILIGVCAALYVLAYRHETPDADIVKKQLLIDSFVSDAPASKLSQDKLGFSEISSALSRFLRNAGTKPPLTLAITGAWGSGKSSLMYFLKENLLSFHMQPVWVNAWHHQSEEQFLAGLLSAIRRHAIPPFWTSAGLLYRWNLLKIRWLDAPLFHYSFAFLFLGSVTFIMTADPSFLTTENELSFKSLPFFSAFIGAIPIINAGMDKISRLSKTSMAQKLFRGGKQGLDLRANVGLREKFATEFGMLCAALGDSTLTIFIDDLDRCKEDRIMDVMETINYLVCSGDCFIVIGMEREPIEQAIATYYKDTYTDLDSKKLKLRARRYLEKIINIEIPVPTASVEQFNALVKGKVIKVKRNKLVWVKQFVLVTSLFASIVLGHYLASFAQSPAPKSATTITPAANQETPKLVESEAAVEPTIAQDIIMSQIESDNKTEFIIIPLIFIIAIGMMIRAERYWQRKRIVESDSEPFLEAISIWAQVMGMSQKTPRSIKRFVNRTRFLAMRNTESETNIKEENLVTLAALIDFAKDRGLTELEAIEQHIPPIDDPALKAQVFELIKKCHTIGSDKRAQLQRWIRGFNVT